MGSLSLDILRSLSPQEVVTQEILRQPDVISRICAELAKAEDINNYRLYLNLDEIPCTLSIFDLNQQITSLSPVNDQTYDLYLEIRRFGSVQTLINKIKDNLERTGNNLKVVELLLKNGANPNNSGDDRKHPLAIATKKEDYDMMELLLKYKANPDIYFDYVETPLISVIKSGRVELVNLLLRYQANPNYMAVYGDDSPLTLALKERNLGLVSILLEAKADPNLRLRFGTVALIELVKSVKDSYNQNKTIHLLIDELLKHGAQINAVDNDNQTALGWAIKKYYFEIAHYLIEKGANVNIPDRYGNTPLIHASKVDNPQLVYQILEVDKSSIDHQNNHGETALILFKTIYRDAGTINYLIKAGANLEITDQKGRTALVEAITRSDISKVKALLEAGAKPGKMPNWWMKREVFELLQKYGAL